MTKRPAKTDRKAPAPEAEEVSALLPPDPGMRRCAILQLEARHEETLPSMILAANRAGWFPHVLVHHRCKRRRGDIFLQVPGLKAEVSYCNFGGDDGEGEISEVGQRALRRIEEPDIDFVLMNSFNRERGCLWARGIQKPVLAVVHNIDHLLGDAFSSGALRDPCFQFIALGPHVASELIARLGKTEMDRIDVIEPCVWSVPDPLPKGGEPRRIAIPGAISTRTRDYPGLLNAVAANPAAYAGLRFVLGSGGKDREGIEAEVRARGLTDNFEFLPLLGDQVSHEDYFRSLRDAQAILPLMPQDFDQYQRVKITSSVSSSVGFAVPMVMDRWSRHCYRAPMLVSDMWLEATLEMMRGVSEAELDAVRTALMAYRRQAIAENTRAFARLAGRALG